MQLQFDALNDWSTANLMNINTKKTKEMLMGRMRKNPPDLVQLNGQPIERVKSYKLLGLRVNDALK